MKRTPTYQDIMNALDRSGGKIGDFTLPAPARAASVTLPINQWIAINEALLEARADAMNTPHDHETAVNHNACELCGRGPEDSIHIKRHNEN